MPSESDEFESDEDVARSDAMDDLEPDDDDFGDEEPDEDDLDDDGDEDLIDEA